MKKVFEISPIDVTVSIGASESIIIPKGRGIPEWENFFITHRDKEGQTPANKTSSEAARMLLKWAGTCRAELICVANEVKEWIFVFRFESAKDASESLRDAEMLVLGAIRG